MYHTQVNTKAFFNQKCNFNLIAKITFNIRIKSPINLKLSFKDLQLLKGFFSSVIKTGSALVVVLPTQT